MKKEIIEKFKKVELPIELDDIEEKVGKQRIDSLLEDNLEFVLFDKRFVGLPESEKEKIKVYVDLWDIEESEDEDDLMSTGDAGFIVDYDDKEIVSGKIVFDLIEDVLTSMHIDFDEFF